MSELEAGLEKNQGGDRKMNTLSKRFLTDKIAE